MSYTVVLTVRAKADLADAFRYLNDLSPTAALAWLIGAERAFGALERFCGYAAAREAVTLGRPLRQRVFRSHRIIFSADETAQVVTVYYVRHAAQRSVGEDDAGDDDEPS